MKMADMRVSDADKKAAETKLSARMEGDGGPDYPWCLCLSLDEHVLQKLGISELPKAGASMHLEGIAKVKAVRMESRDGGEDRSVELQIVSLGVESGEADGKAKDDAGKLYDGAGARKAASA